MSEEIILIYSNCDREKSVLKPNLQGVQLEDAPSP